MRMATRQGKPGTQGILIGMIVGTEWKKNHSMKMQNLKKRAENKSRVWSCPIKRAKMEARVLELKKLKEIKRAIIASAKEEEVALDEKTKALKKTT